MIAIAVAAGITSSVGFIFTVFLSRAWKKQEKNPGGEVK